MVREGTLAAAWQHWRPVGVDGHSGGQTDYIRSTSAMQTSKDLKEHQQCVNRKMKQVNPGEGNINQVQAAFYVATKKCSDKSVDNERLEDILGGEIDPGNFTDNLPF